MKKFLAEFKEFISKGNVMTMAVGVIIGAAFTAIVNSLVADIITPLIGVIIGGINFTGIAITVGSASILVGNFIQAIINFLLTAFCLFIIIKFVNALSSIGKKKTDEVVEEAPAEPSEEVLLLREIRDSLKKD